MIALANAIATAPSQPAAPLPAGAGTPDLFDELFARSTIGQSIVATIVLMILAIVARTVVLRLVTRSAKLPTDMRRRWIVNIRGVTFLILFIGVVLIWAAELRTVALSLFAIAAAIVIATKELIACITGSAIRAGGQSYTIGDRIEINGLRGEVIDRNLVATRMFELGPAPNGHQYTGRVVSFPNSLLTLHPVLNERMVDGYTLHNIHIELKHSEKIPELEQALLDAGRHVCEPYLEAARSHMKRLEESDAMFSPDVTPRVTVRWVNSETVELILRLPVRAGRKARTQQKVLRFFLDRYRQLRVSPAPATIAVMTRETAAALIASMDQTASAALATSDAAGSATSPPVAGLAAPAGESTTLVSATGLGASTLRFPTPDEPTTIHVRPPRKPRKPKPKPRPKNSPEADGEHDVD